MAHSPLGTQAAFPPDAGCHQLAGCDMALHQDRHAAARCQPDRFISRRMAVRRLDKFQSRDIERGGVGRSQDLVPVAN